MTAAAHKPALTSVLRQGGECLGFLMSRGRDGVEGFTADQRSVGVFQTENEAIAALLNPNRGGER